MAILDDLMKLNFGQQASQSIGDIITGVQTQQAKQNIRPIVQQLTEQVAEAETPSSVFDYLFQGLSETMNIGSLANELADPQMRSIANLALAKFDTQEVEKERQRAETRFEWESEAHPLSIGQMEENLRRLEWENEHAETPEQQRYGQFKYQAMLEMLRAQMQERLQMSLWSKQRENRLDDLLNQSRVQMFHALMANPMTSEYLNKLPPDKDTFDYLNPFNMDLMGMARDIAAHSGDMYEPVYTQRVNEVYGRLVRTMAPVVQQTTMEDYIKLGNLYTDWKSSYLDQSQMPPGTETFQGWLSWFFGSYNNDIFDISGEVGKPAASEGATGKTGMARRTPTMAGGGINEFIQTEEGLARLEYLEKLREDEPKRIRWGTPLYVELSRLKKAFERVNKSDGEEAE
jgi:hypothetical protein